MSEVDHYVGKLIPVEEKYLNETLEDICKRILEENGYTELNSYCDSYEEMLSDELYREYVTHDDCVYKVEKRKVNNGDVFFSRDNPDGTIDFHVMYYNGGCSFDEAIEEALENKEKSNWW